MKKLISNPLFVLLYNAGLAMFSIYIGGNHINPYIAAGAGSAISGLAALYTDSNNGKETK